MKQIAIIIPAYKTRFLRETLESVARQTSRNFTLYVGDDASPEDVQGVVRAYESRMDIVYHRFPTNLGRTDLTAHWARCISLSHEPVIWLFSDDDLMPADAVERIERALADVGSRRVMFRFPLKVVDESGKTLRSNPSLTDAPVTGFQLLLEKLSGRITSAACEYVFSRDVWEQAGGFVKFPLAWCSDDATWANFGEYTGAVRALPGQPVSWRNAAETNISCSSRYDREKLQAIRLFLDWIGNRFGSRCSDPQLHAALKSYMRLMLRCSVRWNYGRNELFGLCRSLWRISPNVALYVYFHHLRRRHRQMPAKVS